MTDTLAAIPKPERWDVPFDPEMTDADVDRVLAVPPFSQIDPDRFPPSTPLRGIVANDCRLRSCENGELIVREGDYGSSLFFIMEGRVRVVLATLPHRMLGRAEPTRRGVLRSIAQLWTNHRTPEFRDARSYVGADAHLAQRGEGEATRIFLQDVPGVLDRFHTTTVAAGQIFGEIAALTRQPRTASVFAAGDCLLLEMRWQGFRDIRRRAEELRRSVDERYRATALRSELKHTGLFRHLDDRELEAVADEVTFEPVGDFDWFGAFKKLSGQDPAQRLAHEPVIAAEGDYPDGVIMVRTGFVRVSRRFGDGERTMSYLGRGHLCGFEEVRDAVPLQRTIRAVGYVDIIRVPARTIQRYVLTDDRSPHGTRRTPMPGHLTPVDATRRTRAIQEAAVDPGMLEFLVEKRFINGTSTMLIDLDRCTGCDDCVRACAAAHDGNPRFLRQGEQFGHHLVTNACMHCMDPVCMIGCPTGAIHRSEAGGEVLINDLTCIGCATCANSCPYGNIRMVEIRDATGAFIRDEVTNAPIVKATKCDLSPGQLGGPPCQRACPHDALTRVTMQDTEALAAVLNR